MKTITQKDLEKGLTVQEQTIFFEKKPFTVQTADKTSEDIRRLRKSNYGRQPISMIVKNLRKTTDSIQSDSQKASLCNAIKILEDLDGKERNLL